MIDIIQKLKMLGSGGKLSESYIEVIDILTMLRDTSSPVSVNLEGMEQPFESYLTALNTKHKVMVIDAAKDTIPAEYMTKGRGIVLSTTSHGREICFRSQFLEPFVPDLSLGHLIEMPKVLGTEQPRGAFRVLLDELRHHVAITLMDERDHLVNGVVKNISKSGVGLQTCSELPGELATRTRTVSCKIALEDEAEISCRMEICNIQNHSNNGSTGSYVGGRMFDFSQEDSNILTSFIGNLKNQHMQALTAA